GIGGLRLRLTRPTDYGPSRSAHRCPLSREATRSRTARTWFRSRHASENPGRPPAVRRIGDGRPATTHGALALALVPGKPFVDRVQRPSADLDGAPDRARTIGAIEQ